MRNNYPDGIKLISLRAAVLSFLLLVAGCSSVMEKNEVMIADNSARSSVLKTLPHPLYSVDNNKEVSQGRVWVFIEGDGRAWLNRNTPGTDPTPKDRQLLSRAIAFPERAIYLARPCQYVRGDACRIKVWTEDRFSEETMSIYHEALDQIMSNTGAERLALVGYSGGGAIAVEMAASRQDVESVQTISGNIDPEAWVKHHKISGLNVHSRTQSASNELQRVPQRHFAGTEDKVIPEKLIQSVLNEWEARCATVVAVDTDHHEWSMLDSSMLLRPIGCRQAEKTDTIEK